MKYRKLRIAWSVMWAVLAVLLCALWWRSYWWVEQLNVPVPSNQAVGLGMTPGSFVVVINPNWGTLPWTRLNQPAEDWLAVGVPPFSRLWGRFKVQGKSVVIPFWFLLVTTACIGMIPWLLRRPYQFSLRALLVATTLVTLGLGLAVYAAR